MSSPSPRHKFEEVSRAAANGYPPSDALENDLYCILRSKTQLTTAAGYAYDIFKHEEHRGVVDAFSLAAVPLSVVSRVLAIPVEVLTAYQYLFFDVTTFRNRLEKISFASSYEGSSYSKELLRTGVMVGGDYLMWMYGGQDEIDTRQVIRHTMTDSYYRGMAHKGNSITSQVTKEAQKWWGTAIKNAEVLERIDPRATRQAYEELRIALDGVDETTSVEKSPVAIEDILH